MSACLSPENTEVIQMKSGFGSLYKSCTASLMMTSRAYIALALFYRLLHTHHHPSCGAGILDHIVPDVPGGRSLSRSHKTKKKNYPLDGRLSEPHCRSGEEEVCNIIVYEVMWIDRVGMMGIRTDFSWENPFYKVHMVDGDDTCQIQLRELSCEKEARTGCGSCELV
jgi:hypothetical protein